MHNMSLCKSASKSGLKTHFRHRTSSKLTQPSAKFPLHFFDILLESYSHGHIESSTLSPGRGGGGSFRARVALVWKVAGGGGVGSVTEWGTSTLYSAFVSRPIPLRLGFRLCAESSGPDSQSRAPGEGWDLVSARHGSLPFVRALPGVHGFRPRVPALRRGEQSSGLSAHADDGLFLAAIRRLSRCRVRQNRSAQENSRMGP